EDPGPGDRRDRQERRPERVGNVGLDGGALLGRQRRRERAAVLHHVGEGAGCLRVLERQHRKQHGGDDRGAGRRADRARELHRGGGLAEAGPGGRAALCTVTWTTPITVPVKRPCHSISTPIPVSDSAEAHTATAIMLRVMTTRPITGNSVVRPVLATRRPVISEPVPMPMVSGTSSPPVVEGDSPRTTWREIGRRGKSETRAAAWEGGGERVGTGGGWQ